MAIIKAVSSKSSIKIAIAYVSKEEKTEHKLLSGYNLSLPETAYEEMQITKEIWNKTDGRTYKHYIQSFAPDEVACTAPFCMLLFLLVLLRQTFSLCELN